MKYKIRSKCNNKVWMYHLAYLAITLIASNP